ncbi:hypothetical protein LS70_004675 [Helicobacter sp. MIT 11-5569]|uniref:hypothetical protein n=1 Tax=Helicobacter sp. MIT 11-5569 TaxID=1548151 RepID=UPI00051F9460|nr:hypothetical protein [Helicobacter sp. MIT 11-5569]TLD83461.1 hypothetical protein LS70_004675 [Helicobacter sp. MIT 11-5569]
MQVINWEELYKLEFVYFKDCYSTCDSYCCKNFLGENFKILNQKAVTLALLEGEYEYYRQKGGIQNITTPAKKEEFTLKNGKKFVLYFLSCECSGLCNPHSMRPLLCRIYPYFPRVSAKGEILGFFPAALMDLFYSSSLTHPCTLARVHSIELEKQLRQNLQVLLEIPLFIFVFRAAEVLAMSLQKYLGNVHIDTIEQKDKFLHKLEWSLLSNKAWNNEEFKESIVQIYTQIAEIYGDFL